MKTQDQSEGAKEQALPDGDPGSPPAPATTAILIVDDSASDAAAAAAVLRRCGYATKWVHDGLEAIEAIRDGSYACVLLDVRMPVFGGQELVDYLAIESPEVLTRVIILTGYPTTAESLRGRVQDIVIKPLSVQKLKTAVAACLARNAGRSLPPEPALASS